MSRTSEKYQYRVLWLEDEAEKVYFRQAQKANVELVLCETGEEAIKRIKDRGEHFDGAILDVRGVRRSGEVVDEGGAIHDVLRALGAVRPDLPAVIFSAGAAGGIQGFDSVKKGFTEGVKIFIKGEDEIKDVCQFLIEKIKNHGEYIVLSRHPHLFNFMRTEKKLCGHIPNLLKFLLQSYGLKPPSAQDYENDPFTKIRKILESSFSVCADHGLLPEAFVNNGETEDEVRHGWCIKGLAGQVVTIPRIKEFRLMKPLIHPVLVAQMGALNKALGNQSHWESGKKYKEYREGVPDSLLIAINSFILVDFISWLGGVLKDCPTSQPQSGEWEELDVDRLREGKLHHKKGVKWIIRLDDGDDVEAGNFRPSNEFRYLKKGDRVSFRIGFNRERTEGDGPKYYAKDFEKIRPGRFIKS